MLFLYKEAASLIRQHSPILAERKPSHRAVISMNNQPNKSAASPLQSIRRHVGLTTFKKRCVTLLVLFALAFTSIVGRLFQLQIIDYGFYQNQVIDELTINYPLAAKRGKILDANGNVLADNKTVWDVVISPWHIQSKSSQTGEAYDKLVANKLSELLGVDYDTVHKKANLQGRYYEKIKDNVEEEVKDELLAFIEEYDIDGLIYMESDYERYYPYGSLASHTIGFTGTDAGLFGLEYSYDSTLMGKDGMYVTAKDAHGNEIPYDYSTYVAAEDGMNLVTTIDTYIQRELELQISTILESSNATNRAAGIVMDVNTGAILAMAVAPGYDLNNPRELDSLSQEKLDSNKYEVGSEEYNAYKTELLYNMWNNKTISELYEPGSTFKAVTAAMGVDLNVVHGDTPGYSCPGYHYVGGWRIGCHKLTGHGTSISFGYGLQQSCNPTMMQLSTLIGTENFYNYYGNFGYFERTGIDLPSEAVGIFHDSSKFGPTEMATASFGQRFKVTMIQHVTAIAAIANGGYLVTPYLVSEVTNSDGYTVWARETTVRRSIISASTSKEITQILEEGVSGDGGAKNAYVKGYRIAAKTGTSQKFDDATGKDTGKRVASTVAYAPADNPSIIALIMVDEPSGSNIFGGTIVAPYISNLMGNLLPYLGYQPSYSEEEQAPVNIGNYRGYSLSNAQAALNKLGVKYRVVGNGSTVVSQFPAAGTQLLESLGTVILYTDDTPQEEVVVPRVVGLTAASAVQAILNQGLNVRIVGAQDYTVESGAVAVSQDIPEGSKVKAGTVITLTFRYTDLTD